MAQEYGKDTQGVERSALFLCGGAHVRSKGRAPVRPARHSLGALALALFLILPLGGCLNEEKSASPKTDIALAEEALKARDIGDAEMYFLRYLRKNPAGDSRWQVWQQLLDICLNIRQDKGTAREYLEIMLLEFANAPQERRSIQLELADLCEAMHADPRAVALWEALGADPDTPDETKAAIYRKLSHAYLRRLEFTLSTDVLELCLKLGVSPATKADCLYDMAENQMLTERLDLSEKVLRELLAIPEATPDRRVLAVFMLADVLEQQERYTDARALFESIRELYPNEKVIEQRIFFLKDKKNLPGQSAVQVPPRFRESLQQQQGQPAPTSRSARQSTRSPRNAPRQSPRVIPPQPQPNLVPSPRQVTPAQPRRVAPPGEPSAPPQAPSGE